jgi:predicted short-subunit dehydrogenase-like oxidoreductase (DUF2520 family)
MNHYNISFAGAGRVAGALCREMYLSSCNIELVVSKSRGNGHSLADLCEAAWSNELVFPNTTNIIIVSVPDRILGDVLKKIDCGSDTLVAHTAGSIGFEVFPEKIKRKGIFYPLQTFSKERYVSFIDLPFFLESSDEQSMVILEDLAKIIGGIVYYADTERRRILHLAAVFVCNFTNHMLTLGKEVAKNSGFTFEVLEPLIRETISKAIDIGPENSQSGPAVRHDHNTIEKHLELLSFSPEMKEIYNEITHSIINYYKMA